MSNKPVLDHAYRYKGTEGRPTGIPLPPAHLPLLRDWTLRKQWRYVGIWTRKQLIPARGTVRVGNAEHRIDDIAFIDDNDGYHPRRIKWKWSGVVGAFTGTLLGGLALTESYGVMERQDALW